MRLFGLKAHVSTKKKQWLRSHSPLKGWWEPRRTPAKQTNCLSTKTDCVKPRWAHSNAQASWESWIACRHIYQCGRRGVTLKKIKRCLFGLKRPCCVFLSSWWILMKESCLDFVSSMMPLSNKLRFVGVFLPHVEMHTKESESSSGTCDTSDFLFFFFFFCG